MAGITIRFSDELYAWLSKTADDEGRSLNAQVNYWLRQLYEDTKGKRSAGKQKDSRVRHG